MKVRAVSTPLRRAYLRDKVAAYLTARRWARRHPLGRPRLGVVR